MPKFQTASAAPDAEFSSWSRSAIKRGIDIGFSVLAAPVAAVPIAIGAAAIAITTHENPIFTQERLGKDGEPFTVYKLRTMSGGDHHTAGQGINDPRCTKVGSFLRRTRIDELPQFANVLKGDMSLVGPRPMNSGEEQAMEDALGFEYEPYLNAYCYVGPGACMPACGCADQSPTTKDSDQTRHAVADQTREFAENNSPTLYARLVAQTIATVVRDAVHSHTTDTSTFEEMSYTFMREPAYA